MNIGFIINKISYGGGERMQQLLVSEFQKHGHKIYAFTRNSNLKEDILSCKIITLKNNKNKIWQFVYETLIVNRLLRKFQIDLLVIFNVAESFLFSSKFSRCKVITTLRVDPTFTSSQFLIKCRIPLSFYLSDGVVFQTKKIQLRYPLSIQNKSIVIPNPVFKEFTVKPQLEKLNRVISVGRLSPEKNFQMLIKAFANTCPNEYTLHIYGDGPLKTELTYLIEELNMKEKVFLEGSTNTIVSILSRSKILVLPSNFEGMPNALIEGMAMGLACISTNFPSGGADELIESYKNGILISVGNQNELTNALLELFENKNLQDKLSKNALLVRERLKQQAVIDSWLSFLQIVVKSNR